MIFIPTHDAQGSSVSTSSPTIALFWVFFFFNSRLIGARGCFTLVLICISLTIGDAEPFA